MAWRILVAAAAGAALLGLGVLAGTHLAAPRAPWRPAGGAPVVPDAEGPTLQGREEGAPRLLGAGPGPEILARLTRLERALETLREEQRASAGRLAAAGEILEWLEGMRPRAARTAASASRTAAVATLRNVVSAQAHVQATGRVDTDADGVGEYAGFRELAGAVAGRMQRPLVPPALSSAFRRLNGHGELVRNGYHYRFYLPGPRGEGIGEPPGGYTAASGIDADLAETTWCCYAWPAEAADEKPVLFLNQAGDVLSTQDTRYAGRGGGPPADAAFLAPGTITAPAALGTQGQDGNVWEPVGSR